MELRTDENDMTLIKIENHTGLEYMLKAISTKFDEVSVERMKEEISRALSNAWHQGFHARGRSH